MENNTVNFYEKFDEIVWDLEKFHSIFYQVVTMGYPSLTESLPTAAVGFNDKGKQIQFFFNPEFWNNLDDYNRAFVISHECLHVILNHGVRLKNLNPQIGNQAADIVINHMLVDKFGFEREKIKDWQNYCWRDTVFGDIPVDENRSFEYYYNKILANTKFVTFKNLMDMHDFLEQFGEEALKDIAGKIAENMYPDDIKDAIKKMEHEWKESNKDKSEKGDSKDIGNTPSNQPGDPLIPGELRKKLNVKSKVLKKWETLVRKFTNRKTSEVEKEQWVRRARRFTTVDPDLLIPSEDFVETYAKDKIDVFLFMDASGSCWNYQDRFLKAAKSLNPLVFNVKLFNRSTVVREFKDETTHGGGSDDFRCMEEYIQKCIKEGKLQKYPSLVFHITDGYDCSGVKMSCQFPKRWHWFLAPNGTSEWIPKDCHIHKLEDFES